MDKDYIKFEKELGICLEEQSFKSMDVIRNWTLLSKILRKNWIDYQSINNSKNLEAKEMKVHMIGANNDPFMFTKCGIALHIKGGVTSPDWKEITCKKCLKLRYEK